MDGGELPSTVLLVRRGNFTGANETLQDKLFTLLRGTARHPTCFEVVICESLRGLTRQVMLESTYGGRLAVHTRDHGV